MTGKNLLKRYSIFLVFFGIFLFYIFSTVPVINIQDEAATYYSAQQYSQTGNIEFNSSLNQKFETNIFHTGFSYYTSSGKILFHTPTGTTIIYSLIYQYLGEKVIYLNSLFSALIVILVYLISYKLFNKNYLAIFSSVLVMFMPLFVRYSVSFFTIIPAIFFSLMIIYYIIKRESFQNRQTIIICTLISSLMSFRLFEGIMFAVIFLLFIIFNNLKIRDYDANILNIRLFFNKKTLSILVIFVLVLLAGFIIPNKLISTTSTGSPFLADLPYMYKNISEVHDDLNDATNSTLFEKIIAYPLGTKIGFSNFSIETYLPKISKNLYSLRANSIFPFFWVLLLLFLLSLIRSKKRDLEIFVGIIFLIFVFTTLLYCSRTTYYGFDSLNINSSLYRYFMLTFILGAICIPSIFLKIEKNLNLRLLITSVLLLVYILASFNYSLVEEYKGYGYTNELKMNQEQYQLTTPNNTIFLLGYYTDKYSYDLNLQNNLGNVIYYNVGEDYYNTPLEETFFNESISVLKKAINEGYSVSFLYFPQDKTSQERYFNLIKLNFKIDKQEISKNPDGLIIYNIKK